MKYLLIAISAILSSYSVYAFPELVRHGYVNCTSCHISPNGGGALTPYGRTLAEDVLSTWHRENEGQVLYNAITLPQWLILSGDFRAMQSMRDTPTARDKQFIVMQGDLEAVGSYDRFSLLATIGKSEKQNAKNAEEALVSHRHFLMYRPNDELFFRLGRFEPSYGLNLQDHSILIRRGIGWDQNTETYNLELAWLSGQFDLFVDAIFGRPDNRDLKKETGFALKGSWNAGDSYKVGVNYFYGSKETQTRHLFGPYGMLGFTKRLILLAEIDFQKSLPNSGVDTFGWVHLYQLDYEVSQGVHVYLQEQYQLLDFKNPDSALNSHGIGFQWFPRPHFELDGQYQKLKILAQGTDYQDFLWLILHYYL